MADSSSSNTKASLAETIGILDKAWEWKWALRLSQFVIFFDIAMVFSGHSGLLKWGSLETFLREHLGVAIVTLAAFTIFASVLVPTASWLIRVLIVSLPGAGSFLLPFDDKDSYERPCDHVTMREFRDDAFEKNDPYWLDRYFSAREQNYQARLAQRRVGDLVLGILFLLFASGFPTLFSLDSGTLIHTIRISVGDKWSWLLIIFISFSGWTVMTTAWFSDPYKWVENPPLYNKRHSPKHPARTALPPYRDR